MKLSGIWPKGNYDLTNTSYFPFVPNALYIGDSFGLIYSLDPTNGSVNWTYLNSSHFNAVYSSPIIDNNDVIYAGEQASYLYALKSDETLKWDYSPGTSAVVAACIDDSGIIYIGVGGGSALNGLYALNPNGSYKWSVINSNYALYTQPSTIANDLIYTVYGGYSATTQLLVINSSGSLVNSYTFPVTSVGMFGPPAVDLSGLVYVTYNNTIYIFNSDGSLNTSHSIAFNVYGYVVLDSTGIMYMLGDNNAYAFRPDGSLKWTSATAGNTVTFGGIALDEGRGVIYYGSDDYNLYAVNIADGSTKWTYPTSQNIESIPAIDSNGVIYVGNGINNYYSPTPTNNYIYAINPSGTLKWQTPSQPQTLYNGHGHFGTEAIALSKPLASKIQLPCFSNCKLSVASRMKGCNC